MPCESTCYLMIYHCDISLWSTVSSKPWSWISFPAVKTLMIRATKRCPGPWPWGNIQVHLITHPPSRAVADLRDLPRSGQWDAVSTRGGQRRDTRSPERSTGCGIIVTLVSSAFFETTDKNETGQEETSVLPSDKMCLPKHINNCIRQI